MISPLNVLRGEFLNPEDLRQEEAIPLLGKLFLHAFLLLLCG